MSQPARNAREPVFFWLAVGLFAALVLCASALALLLSHHAKTIERSGGWGWLLIGGVFVSVATVVCAAGAVCIAISLLRREAHRRLAVVLLILASLEVWVFRGALTHVVRGLPSPDDQVATTPITTDSLVQHFRGHGIDLRPRGRRGGFETEWLLEGAEVGARCEVYTKFKRFAINTPVPMMREYLRGVSLPSVLNEAAALAMYYPGARGKTSDVHDCDAWTAKAPEVTDLVVEAFRSYRPSPQADRRSR